METTFEKLKHKGCVDIGEDITLCVNGVNPFNQKRFDEWKKSLNQNLNSLDIESLQQLQEAENNKFFEEIKKKFELFTYMIEKHHLVINQNSMKGLLDELNKQLNIAIK